MRWVFGILLGVVLTAALPLLAGLLSISNKIVDEREAMLVAIALVGFCLLGILIFKPTGSPRSMRVIRNRNRFPEEEE